MPSDSQAQTQMRGLLCCGCGARSTWPSSRVASQAAGTKPSCLTPQDDAACALATGASCGCICSRICSTAADVTIAIAARYSALLIFMAILPVVIACPLFSIHWHVLQCVCSLDCAVRAECIKQPACHPVEVRWAAVSGRWRDARAGNIYVRWQDCQRLSTLASAVRQDVRGHARRAWLMRIHI
jgi:hypothetical protein